MLKRSLGALVRRLAVLSILVILGRLSPETTEAIRRRPLWAARDIAELLGLHLVYVKNLIRTGQLRAVKLGRRTFVPADELVRFIGELPERQVEAG